MRNIYYNFWVKVIVYGRKNQPERTDWKSSLFILITVCNSLNLFVIMLWLKYLKIISYEVNIGFMSGTIINGSLNYFLEFASPFILLNYFLIFRKDRYKMLIEKYPQKNGKFPLVYCLSSILSWFFSLLLYSLLRN